MLIPPTAADNKEIADYGVGGILHERITMIEIPVLGKVGIPFMMAVVAGAAPVKLDKTRVMEAVIIAIIAGTIIAMTGYYVALPVLQSEVAHIRRDVSEMKNSIHDVKRYQEVRREYRDIQQERMEAKIAALQVEMARHKRQ